MVAINLASDSSWKLLNDDILELVFEQLFEMEPQERTSLIITYNYYRRMDMPWILPSSREVLTMCSLVCRRWRRVAQMRLFRCLCIDSERTLEGLSMWAEGGATSVLPLISLDLRLDFPSPSVLKLLSRSSQLRHLAVRYVDRKWGLDPFGVKMIPLTTLKSFYFSILPRIDYHSVREEKIVHETASYGSLRHLLSSMPNLRKLVISAEFDRDACSRSQALSCGGPNDVERPTVSTAGSRPHH